MDFKQLMNLASQNKDRAKKQQERKEVTLKSSDHKSDKSGVSEAAVKAFLAKKEHEKKQKAAEEEAARRARIEERLAQSLGTKTKESAKGTTCNQKQTKPSNSSGTTGEQPERKNEKQKTSEHRDTKTPHRPSSKKPDTDKTRQSLEPVNKSSDLDSKKPVHRGQANVKKSTAPMDFKALLAVAERNKNGGAKLPPVLEQKSSVKQERSKEGERHHVKKGTELKQGKFVSTEDRAVKEGNTNGQKESKKTSKLQVKGIAGKMLSSMADSSIKQDLKRPSGLVIGSTEKGLVSKASSSLAVSANHGKLNKSKGTTHLSNDKRPVKEGHAGKRRDREALKRKRNPYMDDMDDFIDDGDGDDIDVSKYIKEIFGYDRSRFHDDSDDDLAGMESNYKQIEKEEVKSAKIARLEDEIEQLKELHDLKKQRDKLKKKTTKK